MSRVLKFLVCRVAAHLGAAAALRLCAHAVVTVIALVAPLLLNQPATAAEPSAPSPLGTPAAVASPVSPPVAATGMTMAGFLDRLMIAESGGHEMARNPRSTAVGPYQFIENTWLDLARRLFATETRALTPVQILALRTDPALARRAAEAYTNDNAAILATNNITPTFPRLRLAHLLGPQGAVRVLSAPAQTPVASLVGSGVLSANPFLSRMTAEALVTRAARDLAMPGTTLAGVEPGSLPPLGARGPPTAHRPGLLVRCNLDLPACRHWKALAVMRLPAARTPRKQLALARTAR